MEGQEQAPRLLDQVRNVLRLHHYSIHTERSYIDWMKRYVRFHHLRSREDLVDGERKIEAFLTGLAVRGQVAAATQNQAMNALVFLYRKVLEEPLDEGIDAVRVERKVNDDRGGEVVDVGCYDPVVFLARPAADGSGSSGFTAWSAGTRLGPQFECSKQ